MSNATDQQNLEILTWVNCIGATLILVPISVVFSFVLSFFVLFPGEYAGVLSLIPFMLAVVAAITVYSALQYLFLRQYIAHASYWIVLSVLASLLGWGIGSVLSSERSVTSIQQRMFGVVAISPAFLLWVITSGCIGGALGCAQWRIIRHARKHTSWWVLMTIAVWELWAIVAFLVANSR